MPRPDDSDEGERRADALRRRIEELTGGRHRPPETPHEFVEERMRKEAERRRREAEEGEGDEAEERP
jgi:hypothetical protein